MIRTVCVCPPEVTRRNHEKAAMRGLPWIAASPERGRPLAIVGGGPSAGLFLETILSWPGDVMAINGAYDWLQDAGRIPEWALLVDPSDTFVPMLRRVSAKTQWLVASICDPSTFDSLVSVPVALVKVSQGDEKSEPGDIPGGPTAMTRAPVAAAVLGFRDMTLFGADSCFSGNTTHVYGACASGYSADIPKQAFRVNAGGREWLTDLGLLAQAEYIAEMLPAINKFFPVRLAGDHLASALLQSQEWKLAA